MNTRVFEFSIGILATIMIAMGLLLYALREPVRIASAQVEQVRVDLDEAMTLYAENCSVCHGLAGEGIGATPALDTPALRESDGEALFKIISRGLYGTAMPAWHVDDGGPLSDYQVGEMVSMILYGDWAAVQDRVVNLGLAPRVPFSAEPDPAILAALQDSPDGEVLAQGITLYAGYCVACHGADGLGTTLAPALNDASVRAKETSELLRIVENGVSGTLMAPWSGTLEPQEIQSLLALIDAWESIPAGAIPEPDRPVPVTAESLALGEQLYAANCSHCHAAEGQGTPRAPALNVKGFLESTPDAAIQGIITMGVPGTAMPVWGDRLSDAEIQALVGFLRAWEPDAPEVAEQARGQGPWWATGDNASPAGGGQGGAGRGAGGSGQGSGAGGQSGGGPPSWAGGGRSATAGGATSNPEAAVSKTGATDVITGTHTGGPPEWAGSGTVSPEAAVSETGATDVISGTHTGGGPPEWAGSGSGNPNQAAAGGHAAEQTAETAPAPTDPRQIALFGGLGSLSLLPLGVAVFALLRLRGKDQSSPL